MAVKKKTKAASGKKTTKKASKKATKKSVYKRSQKMIDEMLVKISPTLQEKINNLVHVLENSREGKLGDLSFLAGKILLRAQEISKSLKAIPRKKRK